ncbi:MAG: bifunctional diguanylate cyclase/phosphodiesterase, partial [Rhizobacter sp.]
HRQGDELLREVASRLNSTLRDHDTIARLGADEFAVVVARMRQSSDLERVGERIKQALAQPIELASTRVQVTVSAGVAVYPDDGGDVDELFTHADAAMNHAKTLGRNNVQFYARKLTDEARERLILEADLAQALERQELCLFYQPKVRLRNAEIVGAEALMRWRHGQRGLIPPDRFIRVAEESGLIMDIGRWALHSACAAASRWNQGRATPLKVAVNLSPRQFQGGDLVGTVQDALERHQCRAQWIELEITEGLLLNDREDIRAQLAALHRLGTTIAVDDFGTGYSALSYLTRFPIDTLKVDRSFIRELPEDTEDRAITEAIIAMGRSLALTIVAEGVETPAQEAFLRERACDQMQGYHFSRPIPPGEFSALLRQHMAQS